VRRRPGAGLECLDGVLIVCGDEHDHRQRFVRQLRDDLEARHARHLNVEEHHVGLVGADRGDGFASVRTLRDDLEVLRLEQADLEPAARKRLVIDDDRAEFLVAHAVGSRRTADDEFELHNLGNFRRGGE
jgi:hypothetical protein